MNEIVHFCGPVVTMVGPVIFTSHWAPGPLANFPYVYPCITASLNCHFNEKSISVCRLLQSRLVRGCKYWSEMS